MYGRFADAELFCGSADGGPVLYDVLGQRAGPLLNVTFQTQHSLFCAAISYAEPGAFM
ncbi:hypothetical protein SDC9_183530 [bioreactor metagenome]|uniref:Uncharacterized protein n=1 Tax=bioreactor metagenome TaxID=1076179 RepID=A0A645HAG9_9ZZZZ